MRKLFQHIRRQPKQVRDNYALGLAGSFTSVVVLLWVVAFPDAGLLDAPQPEVEPVAPFAGLIEESKQRFADLKESFAAVTTTTTQAAAVNSTPASAETIVLTNDDIAVAQEKASTTEATSTQSSEPTTLYTEVLIGTTSSKMKATSTGE